MKHLHNTLNNSFLPNRLTQLYMKNVLLLTSFLFAAAGLNAQSGTWCWHGDPDAPIVTFGPCNDNGTPSDPSDDYIPVTIDVHSIPAGQWWSVKWKNNATNQNYALCGPYQGTQTVTCDIPIAWISPVGTSPSGGEVWVYWSDSSGNQLNWSCSILDYFLGNQNPCSNAPSCTPSITINEPNDICVGGQFTLSVSQTSGGQGTCTVQ